MPDPNAPVALWAAAEAENLVRCYLLDQERFPATLTEVFDSVCSATEPEAMVQQCAELVVALTKLASAGAQLWGDRSSAAVDAIVSAAGFTRPRLRGVDPA